MCAHCFYVCVCVFFARRTLPGLLKSIPVRVPLALDGAAFFPLVQTVLCVAVMMPVGVMYPLMTINALSVEHESQALKTLPLNLASYCCVLALMLVSTVSLVATW